MLHVVGHGFGGGLGGGVIVVGTKEVVVTTTGVVTLGRVKNFDSVAKTDTVETFVEGFGIGIIETGVEIVVSLSLDHTTEVFGIGIIGTGVKLVISLSLDHATEGVEETVI